MTLLTMLELSREVGAVGGSTLPAIDIVATSDNGPVSEGSSSLDFVELPAWFWTLWSAGRASKIAASQSGPSRSVTTSEVSEVEVIFGSAESSWPRAWFALRGHLQTGTYSVRAWAMVMLSAGYPLSECPFEAGFSKRETFIPSQ